MCTTDNKASAKRDLLTIKSRLRNEGLSFLTITLPNFGKDFERCLSNLRVTPADFLGWKRRLCLPAFLQGFMSLIFDAGTGGLLHDPDITAIEGIRQIAYTFKKLAMQCTPKREHRALSDYEEVESELSDSMPTRDTNLFSKISRLLWGSVFNELYGSERIAAKHGPGQTAERISGNRKYAQLSWNERLEPFFPSDIHLMSCTTQFFDETYGYKMMHLVKEEQELPVRVVTVPKTLKGPRVIAMEPVVMQFTQQGLSSYITKKISNHEITGGHINFTDQSINRDLALSASSDGGLATLDLSAASDRVPLSLTSTMLEVNRDLLDAILACRSKAAQLPNGKILTLRKFASMGSALCFPIEAMYFFTVVTLALMKEQKLPVTLRNIKKVTRKVYVYGDDIIVPVDKVEVVLEALTSFYCKVNATKSFWTGKFRESCGMDAYDGYEVTPTYLHHMRPKNKGSAKEIISLVASSNLFYKRGYWNTASLLRNWIERITGILPVIRENSPGLGWVSYQRHITLGKWNKELHRFEVKTYIPFPVYQSDFLDDYPALLKFFITSQNRISYPIESYDEKHLERSPRSGTVCIKRRRTTPY
jgi:hypothetical protein